MNTSTCLKVFFYIEILTLITQQQQQQQQQQKYLSESLFSCHFFILVYAMRDVTKCCFTDNDNGPSEIISFYCMSLVVVPLKLYVSFLTFCKVRGFYLQRFWFLSKVKMSRFENIHLVHVKSTLYTAYRRGLEHYTDCIPKKKDKLHLLQNGMFLVWQ